MLEISPAKVAHVIIKAREYDAKVGAWDESPSKGDAAENPEAILEDFAADPTYAEDKTQAIERRISELEGYLASLAHQLPPGVTCHIEAHVSDNVPEVIAERAREEQTDVTVMATHSRSGIVHVFFGSTTEQVVRSGVAPVLLVHPNG